MDTLSKFPIQKAYKTKLATVPLVIAREAVQAYVFLCGENELVGVYTDFPRTRLPSIMTKKF